MSDLKGQGSSQAVTLVTSNDLPKSLFKKRPRYLRPTRLIVIVPAASLEILLVNETDSIFENLCPQESTRNSLAINDFSQAFGRSMSLMNPHAASLHLSEACIACVHIEVALPGSRWVGPPSVWPLCPAGRRPTNYYAIKTGLLGRCFLAFFRLTRLPKSPNASRKGVFLNIFFTNPMWFWGIYNKIIYLKLSIKSIPFVDGTKNEETLSLAICSCCLLKASTIKSSWPRKPRKISPCREKPNSYGELQHLQNAPITEPSVSKVHNITTKVSFGASMEPWKPPGTCEFKTFMST